MHFRKLPAPLPRRRKLRVYHPCPSLSLRQYRLYRGKTSPYTWPLTPHKGLSIVQNRQETDTETEERENGTPATEIANRKEKHPNLGSLPGSPERAARERGRRQYHRSISSQTPRGGNQGSRRPR